MARLNALVRSRLSKARKLLDAGNHAQAIPLLKELLQRNKKLRQAYILLGQAVAASGDHTKASDCFRTALQLDPDDLIAKFRLGISLRDSGDFPGSLVVLEALARKQPDNRETVNSLAGVLIAQDRLVDAERWLRSYLHDNPQDAELLSNLGTVLKNQGQLSEACNYFRRAISSNPNLPVHDNLGSTLTATGELNSAIEAFHVALRRRPRDTAAHSNLLLTLNYTNTSPDEIYREHLSWNKSCPVNPQRSRTSQRQRSRNQRLRIGYISPDFRSHSVANFMSPILGAHKKEEFEVFCYSLSPKKDSVTEDLQAMVEHWRDATRRNAIQLANLIMGDNIDILIDLAGHTAHNCLPVFRLQPAPVQVTYLGYPNTTGIREIQYRLCDSITDTPESDKFHSETLTRLPGCFLCYSPPKEAPVVTNRSTPSSAGVVYGSFNNYSKISEQTIECWSHVLQGAIDSRLLIKAPALTDETLRKRCLKRFEFYDIDTNRVELLGHTRSRLSHLELYSKVDIALDTFPYNGTTTTCEAIFMGVPVVTLSGPTHRNRVGASLLTALGHPEWIADTPARYTDIALMLGSNETELKRLRTSLRTELLESSLCNGTEFTHGFESALKMIWKNETGLH